MEFLYNSFYITITMRRLDLAEVNTGKRVRLAAGILIKGVKRSHGVFWAM